MKRLASLLIFTAIISLTLNAQSSKPKYYAIDGSEWVTKYDRNKKEILIWEAIDLDLQAAFVAGRLGDDAEQSKTYQESMKKLFRICKDKFADLRKADAGMEILQNAEFRFFLSENGVKARTGLARNNEMFNFEEVSKCFDEVLREYSFNSEIAKNLADPNGRTYNVNFVVNDFAERMNLVVDRIERELLALEFKKSTITRLVPRYETAKKKAETLKNQKARKRQK